MGFVNLFAGRWKDKVNTVKQGPTVRELGISAPLPLQVPPDAPYTGINLPKQGGLKRAHHVRKPNELPREAHLVQRHRRISRADLDFDGDLGLQGFAHRIGDLYPAHEVRQADSNYGTDKRLGLEELSWANKRQKSSDSESIGQTPVSKKAKAKDENSQERTGFVAVRQDGYEYEITGIFGSVTRRPSIPHRHPMRKLSPIPYDGSLKSFTQTSAATLCGSITSNGKYEIEESSFKKEFWFVKDIGEGGFGKVELRKHKKTAQLLVLKTTRTAVKYINNIPAEVYIIRDILGNMHPNLPKLYHFNHSLAQLEYWMEYCDGGDLVSLSEYYQTKNLTIPEGFLWHSLIQLTSALAFIHTGISRHDPDLPPPDNWQPIIHRDIKPDN
ncbi:MAG: hypothetical protein Q9171_007435, partial [Xanthocarpia ochracea]